MAGQTYQVNYIIDVNATNAQSAINSFKQAVSSLNKATKPITDLQRQVRSLMQTMSALGNKTFTVKVDTKPATQKMGKLIRALQMAKNEAQQLNAMGINLGNVKIPKINNATSTVTPSVTSRAPISNSSTVKKPFVRNVPPHNLNYKLFGPTPLTNNGGIAVDMLKGMGIAYGISGIGTLVSNVVEQASEYDNLMKTVENILKSHDSRSDFQNRYNSMSSTIRDVGMETKYKVTEVADAAKFLAMAGLNVDAISQAIRPIADIALVGDTELGETADLVTNIMTAYNIAPNKMRNAADIMTNTFTMSNTTLTEIAESYKYAASLLSAGGVSFEESTAAIGVLGDAGIKGSQAGTTLRTIMANLVNPTKKQAAEWKRIGINIYKKDNTRKSLIEIFRELSKADLDVSAFYKLFHKTAASGAVALTSHADKWENVYLENYLANGLTAQLADKKKNTIQGLWAQLMSVFTDNGVTAFSGVQGIIRSLMSQAINWLKTDEAKNAFQNLSKTLMEFINTIITASKRFGQFINFIAPLFKLWVKFQLMIWPIVKAITAFKSVFLGLMGLRKIGFTILGLGNAFKFLGKSAQFAGVAVNSSFASSAGIGKGTQLVSPAPGVVHYAGPWGSTFALSNTDMRWAQRGWKMFNKWKIWGPLDISEPRYDRGSFDVVQRHQNNRAALLNYQKNIKAYNRRLKVLQGINMAGSLAGSVGVGFGAYKLMEDDSNWAGITAGSFYTAAGVAAMLGPWGIAVGAALGAIGGIFHYVDSIRKSTNALNEITSKIAEHKMISGAITNSENGTMQYLEMQYLKYNDINSAIEKRIELTAKLLGLTSKETPLDDSTGTFSDLIKKGESLSPADKITAIHKIYEGLGVPIIGVDPRNAGIDKPNKGYVSAAATAEVFAPGGFYENLASQAFLNIGKLAMSGAPYSDMESYLSGILDKYNPANIEGLIPVTQIDPDHPYKTIAEMLKDEQTAIILFNKLSDTLNPIKEAGKQFYSELASGNLTLPTLLNFTEKAIPSQGGASLMDFFDPNNVLSWFSAYHFQNGKFVGFSKDNNYYTPQDAAALAASDMQALIKLLDLLGVSDTAAGQTILGPAKQLLSFAQAYTNSSQELIDVTKNQELVINGQLTKWDELSNTYRAIGDDGQFLYVSSSISSLGQSIGVLGKELNLDWNNLSNDFSNTMNGTYNYLLWLGRLKFGNVPFSAFSNTNFSQPGLISFDNVPFSTTNFPQSYISPFNNSVSNNGLNTPILKPGFGFNNNFLNTKLENGFGKPRYALGWTLQEASNIAAAGGANPKGWNNKAGNNNVNELNDERNNGTHTSDYRSHQRERAVPKQININIQNLMNVESIDMTDPNNTAVVNNLKREIAYALYEAAADGTMMLNGLTN